MAGLHQNPAEQKKKHEEATFHFVWQDQNFHRELYHPLNIYTVQITDTPANIENIQTVVKYIGQNAVAISFTDNTNEQQYAKFCRLDQKLLSLSFLNEKIATCNFSLNDAI